jgi:hypothetical protein
MCQTKVFSLLDDLIQKKDWFLAGTEEQENCQQELNAILSSILWNGVSKSNGRPLSEAKQCKLTLPFAQVTQLALH